MSDNKAMSDNNAPKTILREDYSPPSFDFSKVSLHFELDEQSTVVRGEYRVSRSSTALGSTALVLDGVQLELLAISIDGRDLTPGEYTVDDSSLTLTDVPDQFTLQVSTRIDPLNNRALEGLYKSSGNFCTQCEAEGFRKIIYYQDRPDVLSVYTVRVEAEKSAYPVLLSNGNLVAEGELPGGRHYAEWHDPHPKPSYLFALVAGDLEHVADTYTTGSGREIDLRIYVEAHNIDKCEHAMVSLKKSMQWDEDVFGLEYDLDIFMIVAVDDFNMGAMENKGLNIFNSKFVLADIHSATDTDFTGVESVIAHEYFHNWTGNRITCRDWFQLSLKEGLTVFRDQEFSSDLNSRAVKRIGDVALLRARQFPEDAGPMAHPVRPDSYMEINNFYTVTIYEKGAEVIRMMHTLLGPGRFRSGIDLYFERHDGQAVTCEDFVRAMEDASSVDLTQFRHWYSQAGTPQLDVDVEYDQARQQFHMHFKQLCSPTPGQSEKPDFHIPVRLALLDAAGEELPLVSNNANIEPALTPEDKGAVRSECVLDVTRQQQSVTFEKIESTPVPSILRQFSAPVRLNIPYSDNELSFLMAKDSDAFNRWEAGQKLSRRVFENTLAGDSSGLELWADAIGTLLADSSVDPALCAVMLDFPGIEDIAEDHAVIDVDAVNEARENVLATLAYKHVDLLLKLYERLTAATQIQTVADSDSIGMRSLKQASLSLLSRLPSQQWLPLAVTQFETAQNMTDSAAALRLMCDFKCPEREIYLKQFYEKWRGDKLVIDKWFAFQATSTAPDTLQRIEELSKHDDYSLDNPNRVRSLIGAFAMNNTLRFHDASGAGYRLLSDTVLQLDKTNPQLAARLAGGFSRWKRFTENRQLLMKDQLDRIRQESGLSRDLYEIIDKSIRL